MPVKTHTFNGRKYRILIKDADGYCDTDNDHWLIIGRDLSTRVGLETAIHEAMHACRWRKHESTVEPDARDIARFLWRLGYRKELPTDIIKET